MALHGSGVQRSGDAQGDCLFGCPSPNSSIDQCRIMVIVNGYTLFVTSQRYVIMTFTNQLLAKFVHTTCIFRIAGAAIGRQSRRHGGAFVGLAPPKLNYEAL